MFGNCLFGIKEEGDIKKRKRQAALPGVSMSYDVIDAASQGKLRVTICWRMGEGQFNLLKVMVVCLHKLYHAPVNLIRLHVTSY